MWQSTASDIPDATPADLRRLRTAADDPVDTSEIPEWMGPRRPALRDARGRLIKRTIGPIARAILAQLGRQRMTRYRLWQNAKVYCPTLTESAVYGFLGGTRQVGVPYVEALMQAVGLAIVPAKAKKPIPARTKVKKVKRTVV